MSAQTMLGAVDNFNALMDALAAMNCDFSGFMKQKGIDYINTAGPERAAGGIKVGATVVGAVAGLAGLYEKLIAKSAEGSAAALAKGCKGVAEELLESQADEAAEAVASKTTPNIARPYKRPSGATTKAQRAAVQTERLCTGSA